MAMNQAPSERLARAPQPQPFPSPAPVSPASTEEPVIVTVMGSEAPV